MANDLQLQYCIGDDGNEWVVPCAYSYVSSPFGMRWHPISGDWRMHYGVDLPNNTGTPIYASRGGTVSAATYNNSAGYYVSINHGDGFSTIYMHMTHYIVSKGQTVSAGDKIGEMGSTGGSTGPHLHFGVSKNGTYVDPMLYIGGQRSPFIKRTEATVSNDQRIHLSEMPLDPNYRPLNLINLNNIKNGISNEGSPKMNLMRRHQLLGESSHTIFSTYDKNINISDGYGIFGLNSNISSIPNVQKETVMNTYRIKNSDGTISYKKGGLSGESEKLVAAYIYNSLKARGWHHNAILGLLANIKSESGLNPARWEGDVNYSNRPGIGRGFGLIQWTPWNKFCDNYKNPDGSYDWETICDIDVQIQGVLDYQAGSYFIMYYTHRVYPTYLKNVMNSTLYKTNQQFRAYFDETYRFPITGEEFRKGIITTNVTLSETNKVIVLAVAYCWNAERPGECNATTRASYAQHFINMFGEGFNDKLFEPSYKSADFWLIAKDKCNFKHLNGTVLKNSFSYAISRVNEVFKLIYGTGDNQKDFIIDKSVTDWFTYNKDKLKYSYGNLPRAGALMCWKPKKTSLPYKVRFVESVIGTHWVYISEYYDNNTLKEICLKNSDHNWGGGADYMFDGFIYVLHDLNILMPSAEEIEQGKETNNQKTSNASYDQDGNLILTLYNNTTDDKYFSIAFSIKNMKHINNITIKYDAFIENSVANTQGNRISFCFSEQVWNCKTIGGLTEVNTASDEYKSFMNSWPSTYFAYKPKFDNTGKVILYKDYKHPYRYNGPFPSGNLHLDTIEVKTKEKDVKESVRSFDLYKYAQGSVNIDSFNNSGDIQRFVRNHPGYFCVIVKAPAVAKTTQYTSTTIRIKEITAYG